MNKFKQGDKVKWDSYGPFKYGIFDGYYKAEDRYAYVIFKNEGIKLCCVSALSPEEEPAPQPIRKAYTRQEMIEMARVWVESVNGVLDEQLDDDKDNWYRDYGLLGCFINKNFPE